MVDVKGEVAAVRAEIDAAIARVIDSGRFIGGPEVEGFERELAALAGVGEAVGVSSGTDALLAILMALGIGAGDEVVTTPVSFFATAGAIARVGARPVFAEVDDELTLDPDAAVAAMTARTRAVVTVDLFGRPAQLPATGVPVIVDAAQALGAGPVRGVAAAISFFPTKNVGALGDAGAVLTDDAALADRVRLLRTQGARPRHHHVALGGNFRLDAIQAAVLRVRLPRLAASIAARRERAARYREALATAPVRLPGDHRDHVWHQFVIRAPDRDALRAHLAREGIATEVYYPEPLHQAPCFAALGYGSLPHAESACREVLALPVSPALTADDQGRVIAAITAFYR